jgi:hypothetical protein
MRVLKCNFKEEETVNIGGSKRDVEAACESERSGSYIWAQ